MYRCWCILLFFALQGCESHQYVSHDVLIVDQMTSKPVAGARVVVDYYPLHCGGPFAFLPGDPRPHTPARTTDSAGRATLRMATDWKGYSLSIEAKDYSPKRIEVEENARTLIGSDQAVEITPKSSPGI